MLRKAMIWPKAVINWDSVGSSLLACASASPRIMNWRSTAACFSSSTWYSANDLPAVNRCNRSQALRTSCRNLATSSCIENFTCLIERGKEIGVFDGQGLHQVDLALEQLLQGEPQAEVGFGMPPWFHGQKVDQKIQVAAFRVPRTVSRRAEDFQRLHPVLSAQLFQLGSVLFDQLDH